MVWIHEGSFFTARLPAACRVLHVQTCSYLVTSSCIFPGSCWLGKISLWQFCLSHGQMHLMNSKVRENIVGTKANLVCLQ